MKQIYNSILGILLVYSPFVFGQNISNKIGGNYFLGFNTGLTWQTADTRGLGNAGLGLNLEKHLINNEKSTFGLSLRGNYLVGATRGLNATVSKNTELNLLTNGFYGTDYEGEKFVYNNRTSFHHFSLDALIYANRLRAKTGVHLYAFGGLGNTYYKPKTNLLNANSELYDFDSQLFNISNSVDMLNYMDDDYETNLSNNSFLKTFTPSVGIGLGFNISPSTTFGFEYRKAFTQTDFFDGNYQDVNNKVTTNFDQFNYLSLGFGFNIGKFKNATLHTTTTSSNTNSIAPKKNVNAPKINMQYPESQMFTSENCQINVRANIYFLTKTGTIKVYKKGIQMSNFEYFYNYKKQLLTFVSNLDSDTLFLDIVAQNDFGKDSVRINAICDYQAHVSKINQPFVNIYEPFYSSFTTVDCQTSIKANTKNISDKSQIKIVIDGDTLNDNLFIYSINNQFITFDFSIDYRNKIVIIAKNKYGESRDDLELICSHEPPTIQLIKPTTAYSTGCQANATFKLYNVSKNDKIEVYENGILADYYDFNYWNQKQEVEIYKTLKNGSTSVFEVKIISSRGLAKEIVSFTCPNTIPSTQKLVSVDIFSPSYSPFITTNCQQNIEAKTANVDFKNQIQVLVNGIQNNNFTFDFHTQKINLPIYINQKTSVEILVSNTINSSSEKVTIECQQVQNQQIKNPPSVKVINPNLIDSIDCGKIISVEATISNVKFASEISVFVNNQKLQSYQYQFFGGKLTFNQPITDLTSIKIYAQNKDGDDSKIISVSCKNKPKNLPSIAFESHQNPNFGTEILVKANIKNVYSQSQLSVWINGKPLNSYQYNFYKEDFSAKITINGLTKIEIKASNSAGFESKFIELNCTQIYIPQIPKVGITNPTNGLCVRCGTTQNIYAFTQNIKNLSQIKVLVDEVLLDSNRLNFSDNNLTFDVAINSATKIEIEVQNQDGSDQTTLNLRCEEAIQAPNPTPPSINFNTHQSAINCGSITYIVAQVQNIVGKNQLRLTVNGNPIGGSAYDFANGILTYPLLIDGTKNIQLVAENQDGSDRKTIVLDCASKEIDFEIKDGELIPKEEYIAEVKIIGAAIPNHEVMVQVSFGNLAVDAFGTYSGRVKTSNVNDGNMHTWVSAKPIPANSAISLNAKSFNTFTNSNMPYVETSTQNQDLIKVLRNGDNVPQIKGWGNQTDVKTYLKDYIENNKIKLEPNQAIYLIEVGTTDINNQFYDLQDCVIVVSLIKL